jgi:predicted nuclease with TOPRIM domain
MSDPVVNVDVDLPDEGDVVVPPTEPTVVVVEQSAGDDNGVSVEHERRHEEASERLNEILAAVRALAEKQDSLAERLNAVQQRQESVEQTVIETIEQVEETLNEQPDDPTAQGIIVESHDDTEPIPDVALGGAGGRKSWLQRVGW